MQPSFGGFNEFLFLTPFNLFLVAKICVVFHGGHDFSLIALQPHFRQNPVAFISPLLGNHLKNDIKK